MNSVDTVTYREAGTGGIAKSTEQAKKSAIVHFVTYLMTKNLVYLEMSENELCSESLLRQFGTYLISTATTKSKNPSASPKLLKRDTAVNFFGNVVQVLKKRFKLNDIFRTTDTWSSEVRMDILRLVARRNIEDGIEIKEKSKGVGRDVMIIIGKELMTFKTRISYEFYI